MKNLVVVGSINLDLVVDTPHLPHPGETISGTDFAEFEGGKGANQAVGIARLGFPVRFLGYVGEDFYGIRLREALQRAGVDTDRLETCASRSGLALITHDTQGENSIVVVPGANGMVSADYLRRHRSAIEDAAMILAQLEIPLETVVTLSEMAVAAGVPFMLDPAPARSLPASLLKTVTWRTPNETEAAILAGSTTKDAPPEEIAQILLGMGPRNVALKLGQRGVYLAGEDTAATLVPSRSVNVVDTTAAGDTFNAAFAVRLAHGDRPADAAAYATAAAALSVTVKGAQPSMPTAQRVADFIAEKALTHPGKERE